MSLAHTIPVQRARAINRARTVGSVHHPQTTVDREHQPPQIYTTPYFYLLLFARVNELDYDFFSGNSAPF